MHRPGKAPGRIHRQIGIVAVHIHTQGFGGVGHQAADGAQADDTQLFTLDFGARKGGFALFHQLAHLCLALEGLGPLDAGNHLAGADDHAGDHQLLHRVGVGAGGVEHHDAGFAALVHRNVVDAGARPGDGLEGIGERHIVHGGGADHDAVRVLHLAAHGVGRAEPVGAARGNLVQG